MKRFLFILLMIAANGIYAQSVKKSKLNAGLEVDVLPYLTGGYYGSIWLSHNHLRYRAVLTQVTTPEFMLDEGFTNNDIKVYAVIADYFFKPEVDKFWVGMGVEYWKASIQTDLKGDQGRYNNTMFTLGGGYVWNLGKHLYLNPWVAIHLRIAGDSEVAVDEKIFKPAAVVPEGSLKIGWRL